MTGWEFSIVQDVSLSTDARIVALYLAQKGDGFHELSREDVQDLLSTEAGRDRAQRAVRQLERRGLIERRAGGRGHADTFAVKGPAEAAPIADSDRGARHLNGTVVGVDAVAVTPLNPPAELDEKTAAVVERFEGCRGALTDYLLAFVPSDRRRYAYAQTVASWFDGGDPVVWRLADGSSLPAKERPGMLAATINELAAGDESKMKRPVGDPVNLRTKLNINLKKRADHERSGAKPNSGTAATARRGAAATAGARPERRHSWGADLDEAG